MNPDPIVKEVREAGAKLAAEAGYDVHRFFEKLREAEKKYGQPLVREPVAKSSWKRPGLRLTAKGAGLSSAIIKERKREDIP
jgi:hypothetical protein